MLIAIPSKNRPSKVRTQAYLGGAGVVYVPELEVASYLGCGVPNVRGVPDGVVGITATRNWILDHAEERRVVFVDDDVEQVGWVEMGDSAVRMRKMTGAEAVAEFERLFEVTEDLGLRVWGASTQGATRSVYPYRPFIWRTYVTASCMGLINGEQGGKPALRFDPAYRVKEDYELTLRALEEDGAVVGARYFYWYNSHWKDDGGCRDYRTGEMELDAIRRLQKRYPGCVVSAPNAESPYSIKINL